MEDSLKLVVQRAIEEGLAPLEQRIAQLESRAGITAPRPEAETPARGSLRPRTRRSPPADAGA